MRIRSIWPDQWVDEDFVELSPFARLLTLGIRNVADDNGIFEFRPSKIKMQVLPADNLDVDALLDELITANQFMIFEADGRKYGIIRNFYKFQSPQKPKFRYPTPDAELPDGYSLNHKYKEQASNRGTIPVQYKDDTGTGKVPTIGSGSGSGSGDGNGKKKEKSCSESAKPASKPEPASPVLLTFPLADGTTWDFTEAKLAEYRETFPNIDVMPSIRMALQWCRDKPTNRKTKTGISKFITGWISRDIDSGKAARNTPSHTPRRTAEDVKKELFA